MSNNYIRDDNLDAKITIIALMISAFLFMVGSFGYLYLSIKYPPVPPAIIASPTGNETPKLAMV